MAEELQLTLDDDDKTSKSSDSDGEEEDEGKLFVSSVMMMDWHHTSDNFKLTFFIPFNGASDTTTFKSDIS